MRIRRKKWAKKELEECNFYIDNPVIYKNNWNGMFKENQDLHIELGCGKGTFISELAYKNQNINYVAIDMIEAMLGLSKRTIEEKYNGTEFKNLLLIRANVERILDVFGENDRVGRIYINFCNPWPKAKHKKRRLTHIRQLNNYKIFLNNGGEIFFKTDDDELFEDTLDYLRDSQFEIVNKTYCLQSEDIFNGNILTEHEKMFIDEGINIKALIARK